MLLHMAAASGEAPEGRQRVVRWLRAALALIEDDEAPGPVVLPPGAAKALEEIAAAFNRAAEHAEYLAEKASLMGAPRP